MKTILAHSPRIRYMEEQKLKREGMERTRVLPNGGAIYKSRNGTDSCYLRKEY